MVNMLFCISNRSINRKSCLTVSDHITDDVMQTNFKGRSLHKHNLYCLEMKTIR